MGQLDAVRRHLQDHPIQQVHDDESDNAQEETPQFESDPQVELKEFQRRLHALSETQAQFKESLSEYTVRSIPQLKSEIEAIRHQIDATLRENQHHTTQLEALKLQQEQRTNEVDQLKADYNNRHKSASGNLLIPQAGTDGQRIEVDAVEHGIDSVEDLENYVKNRELVLWNKIEILKERMQEQSRIEVVEWFGQGPHYVEFEVEYPHVDENHKPEDWPRVRGVLLIELAPLDLMPVAINIFLQQVIRSCGMDVRLSSMPFTFCKRGHISLIQIDTFQIMNLFMVNFRMLNWTRCHFRSITKTTRTTSGR